MIDINDIRGKPQKRERNGRYYWYDRYCVGNTVKERFLGEDTPEVRKIIDWHSIIAENLKIRRQRMSSLARILHADRFLRLDKATGSLFSAMSRSGFFRLGGVVVGTHAFRAYECELGIYLTIDTGAITQDVDIAGFENLSVAISETDVVNPDMGNIFKDLDFKPIPSLPNEQTWKWTQTKGQVDVEFLTPSTGSERMTKTLPSLGISAKGMNFLNYLLRTPINAVLNYGSGILVKVPAPERFAIHKLIVSERRKTGPNPVKARKDRLQAKVLLHALAEDRPEQLIEAYYEAMSEGSAWQKEINAALAKMPEEKLLLSELGANINDHEHVTGTDVDHDSPSIE